VVARDTVAEIGLDRLRVSYHAIRRRAPEAAADGGLSAGAFRRAVWAGAGLLAVTGWDDAVVGNGDKRTQKRTPAGLRLLDTRTWSERTIDGGRTAVTVAGRLLLASGSGGPAGDGLAVYDRTGRRRFHAFGWLWLGAVPTAERYAYAGLTDTYRRHRVQVLDLRSGRVVARPWVPALVTLLSGGVPHVCWC
jgi:hypothetical protein